MYTSPRRLVPFFALLFGTMTIAVSAQTVVKKGPPPVTSPTSGAEMYTAYCAVCHGTTLKGDGPAASAMKMPPTNLTLLTAKNNGKFPSSEVYTSIKGDTGAMVTAHGTADMPVWGIMFNSMSHSDTSEVHLRLANLVRYIESMQVK
jgi:mono/diheme cytochrome c family protein